MAEREIITLDELKARFEAMLENLSIMVESQGELIRFNGKIRIHFDTESKTVSSKLS
jgi:hypothetical protein